MSEEQDKQLEMAQNFRRMMQVTKVDDKDNEQRKLAHQFMMMMDTTRQTDSDMKKKELARQFAEMMEQTKSFDAERDKLQKAGEVAISDAFARMMTLTHQLEKENEKQLEQFDFPPDVSIEHFPTAGDKLFQKLISKLPKKVQRFPRAFRRNPKAVIKYFFAMIIGRILAITLYVIAAFIPALPIPESVTGAVGKAPAFLGGALGTMRGAVMEFSMQSVTTTVTNIPTDINKLLQKIGEFFQYYGRRAGKFFMLAIKHPKLAFGETRIFCKQKAPFFLRMGKGACGVAFSFLMIKLAMVFLLPLFGGIAITVLGFKISIILIVVVRMAVSTGSEVIGRVLGGKMVKYCKEVYKNPEILWSAVRQNMDQWMENWNKNRK